jgi:hypothetical protein
VFKVKDALFQGAKREIEALGVQILEARLLPEMAGSWYIIVNSKPMLRLMWDRSSGWLVLEERIDGIPAGPLIWKDIWIAENFDGAAIKRGVEIIGKKTVTKSGAVNLNK